MKIKPWDVWAYVCFEGEGGSGGASGDGSDGGAGSGSGSGSGAGTDAPWYVQAGIPQEQHDYIKTKGWDGPASLLESQRNLEKLVGRERLPMPTGKDDAESIDKITKALGRPDGADGYALPDTLKDAFKPEAVKHFNKVFHDLKLADWQAEGLLASVHKFTQDGAAEKTRQTEAQVETDKKNLEAEWGNKLADNEDLAGRAYRAVGLSEDLASKIEGAIGYKAFMLLFHNIGSKMAEDTLKQDGNVGGAGQGSSFEQTPEVAQAQIDKLLADPEFMKRYTSSNQKIREPAIEEMQKWHKIKAGAKR